MGKIKYLFKRISPVIFSFTNLWLIFSRKSPLQAIMDSVPHEGIKNNEKLQCSRQAKAPTKNEIRFAHLVSIL